MPAPVDGHSNRIPALSYPHARSDLALRDDLLHSLIVPADPHLIGKVPTAQPQPCPELPSRLFRSCLAGPLRPLPNTPADPQLIGKVPTATYIPPEDCSSAVPTF